MKSLLIILSVFFFASDSSKVDSVKADSTLIMKSWRKQTTELRIKQTIEKEKLDSLLKAIKEDPEKYRNKIKK